jgi:putative tryptophan/tyrosine transport system substrate-binding protein
MDQLERRRFLLAAGVLLAAPLAGAQQPKMLRVGTSVPDRPSPIYNMITLPFLQRMRELGYHEGRNFIFETEHVPLGSTDEDYLRAYRTLATRKVDLFLAFGLETALKSALAVAGTAPIVMIAINWDPFAKGYVTSLRRSGSNITGVVFREVELTSKRFQLLKETFPGLSAATVLWDRLSADQWKETQTAAASLGLRIHGIEFEKTPYDYDRAFAAIPSEFRRSVMMLGSPRFALPERRSLPDAALRHRLPTMYVLREYVEAGGLMSYGPNYSQMVARAADYVDRIAKGAKPEELPIEQPSTFELALNLKTAKALAITIPQAIFLRANRVIE